MLPGLDSEHKQKVYLFGKGHAGSGILFTFPRQKDLDCLHFAIDRRNLTLNFTLKSIIDSDAKEVKDFPVPSDFSINKIISNRKNNSSSMVEKYKSVIEETKTVKDILKALPENVPAAKVLASFDQFDLAVKTLKEELKNVEEQYVVMFKSSLRELCIAEDQSQLAQDRKKELDDEQGLRALAEKKLADYMKDYDQMLEKYDEAMKALDQRIDSDKQRDLMFQENERLKREVQILKAECYDFAKTKKELDELKQKVHGLKESVNEEL